MKNVHDSVVQSLGLVSNSDKFKPMFTDFLFELKHPFAFALGWTRHLARSVDPMIRYEG